GPTAAALERLTTEEVQGLSDVKTLVNQLYEALNVREHQLQKEVELTTQLETLQQELLPLEEKKLELEQVANRRSNWMAWAGLGLMSVQFGILARLTWWEYSWDIMEPVTYFVTYGTAMAAYAYFVLTREEYILNDVRDRQQLLLLHKKAKKTGFDVNQYNVLKDQIAKLELDLKRLRDPLKLRLPPKAAASGSGSGENLYFQGSGGLLPEPHRTSFGIIRLILTVVPGLLIGAAISKNIANFL
uniref:Calcium uniporter protein,Protein EMRE homolog, mitochondrial-like Protein fusion n=1 Tax=Tribolium castaneum TaxID=7070 RepID=UPI001652B789|nr:Chain A, Calcium uniporter protein,Protein EMRE homolog, mitochondrial-like Protein fusion [Tribolium castaneum]6X4S_B Chain B, Calcium uniporter protein,Protein EMRE homolog, mitochondrial-like Protein fusion [Tribolium castaneum]6X4S_C Chain C, Calcium uniporter protein,Protein EMRE homolog, mitochondrial-like Protein fusion [Tribolium castaneum]6X4S_D Chain D, Calcium uniporter protein,Protein EMRE homolog, mitochondrial-like Protein fusion [Tribolium castaneum]6X4S_E Chain E, Calcium uni